MKVQLAEGYDHNNVCLDKLYTDAATAKDAIEKAEKWLSDRGYHHHYVDGVTTTSQRKTFIP